MKYIRGQDGCIYSVSKLTPPCEEHPKGEAVWKLRVVTATGSIHVYATYSTEAVAIKVYSYVERFMGSEKPLLTFHLGLNGEPFVKYIFEVGKFREDLIVFKSGPCPDCGCGEGELHKPGCKRLPENKVVAPIEPRPWLNIPASAVTPWWRKLWPWSRKEKANDE